MKKIFTTVLCLGFLATPCMACPRHDYYRNYPPKHHQPQRVEKHYYHNNYYYNNHRYSRSTKVLATVAGVAGVAALITAIAD